MNAVEAGQGAHGKTCISRRRCWSAEIDLRHLVGLGVAGIAHIESDVQPAIAGSSDTQTGILEPRVGQTVTKGIERSNALPLEPTITDIDALRVGDFTIRLQATLRVTRISGRIVLQALRPGERQASRGADTTLQDVCCRLAAFG